MKLSVDNLISRAISLLLASLLLILGPGVAWAASDQENTYIINGKISNSAAHKAGDDFKLIQTQGNGYSRYFDYPLGYVMDFPSKMTADFSAYPIKTVMSNADTCLEIYYDDFTGTVHNAAGYIKCSRDFLTKNSVHQVDMDQNVQINGRQVQLLQWHRAKLSSLAQDKNYYLRAIIIKSPLEVLTLLVKSSQPINIDNWMPVINSVVFITPQGTKSFNLSFSRQARKMSPETEALYQRYFADESALTWGVYEPTANNNLSYLNSLEKGFGYKFPCILWYQSLGSQFPRNLADNAYNQGKFLELTMATWDLQQPNNTTITYDVLNGKYDAYLIDYARKIKAFGHPLLFRLNNEMNGDWCYWSAYYSATDTELFRAMWRHIYDIFQEQGVNNAIWVWNPNELSFPGFKWNSYVNYFPGSDYVDVIGLTGYNTGNYYPGERWRDFRSIYAPLYNEYSQVFDYPFMITEFACSSIGGDKTAWVKDMFLQIKAYKKIKLAIWFNGVDRDAQGNPARIYRLDQDNQIIEQFTQGLKNYN